MEQRMEQMIEAYLTDYYPQYEEIYVRSTKLKADAVAAVTFTTNDGDRIECAVNLWDVVLWLYNKQIG